MNNHISELPQLKVAGVRIPTTEIELRIREIKINEVDVKFEASLVFGDEEVEISFEELLGEDTLKGEVKIKPDLLLWAGRNGVDSQMCGVLEYIICEHATLTITVEENGAVFLRLADPQIRLLLEEHFDDKKLDQFLAKWKKPAHA